MPIIVPGRRIGLSRLQNAPPLLGTVGNQRTHVSSKSAASNNPATASKMGRAVKNREPESITAQPLSSSSDSEDYEDDDAKNQRGAMKRTVFSSTHSPSHTSNGQGNAPNRSKPSSQRMANRSRNDESSSLTSSKRRADDTIPTSSNHLTDGFGFTTSSLKKKRKKAVSYGNKSSQSKSSQPRSSQKSAPRSSAAQPSQAGFIKPESLSPEKRKPTTFIAPPSENSSPDRERQKPEFKGRNLMLSSSPESSKFKMPDSEDDDARPKGPRKTRMKARRSSPKPAVEEFSQKPVFKVYASDDENFLNDSDEEVANATKKEFSDDEAGDISMESPVAVTTRCPMCHEVVNEELLEKYSDHGRMNIRKQAEFCKLHKRNTAMDFRSQKGYPAINWGTIDKRCEKHHDFLKEILEGTQQSYYRKVLREKVESGKNRTLLKTQDSLTPGYYGPRGLRAMTEYIMRTLSSVVRKRAIEDRLVSARGYTGYVQIVLVPELAVRLIMEDMSVGEDDARKIMHESIEVGELLYEDVGDFIAGLSDEDG
ncbi:hypothetical protein GGR53DRAFT_503947 [Hypoxylon sp. FL1150]|nr:hypothetical protein GGR53DRAFT_503947 [Hypoxylon sp. FL1150]